MVSELIGKYIWLVQSLIAAGDGGMTFKELNEKYSRRFGQAYSRRTFNNHRLAVADLFGIDIDCRSEEHTSELQSP